MYTEKLKWLNYKVLSNGQAHGNEICSAHTRGLFDVSKKSHACPEKISLQLSFSNVLYKLCLNREHHVSNYFAEK